MGGGREADLRHVSLPHVSGLRTVPATRGEVHGGRRDSWPTAPPQTPFIYFLHTSYTRDSVLRLRRVLGDVREGSAPTSTRRGRTASAPSTPGAVRAIRLARGFTGSFSEVVSDQ